MRKIAAGFLGLVATFGALAALLMLLPGLALWGPGDTAEAGPGADGALMDRFDMFMTNLRSDALEGLMAVEKVYWLKDADVVAPRPDDACAHSADDAAAVLAEVRQAGSLLEGKELVFARQQELLPGAKIHWYRDDTILAITWKTKLGDAVYTFTEVVIAHPSQFRRFLADGTYGAARQYYTTEMAAGVNAVAAGNGDFYKYRPFGIVVYNGTTYRAGDDLDNRLDTCMIDENGDLHLIDAGSLPTRQAVEDYVARHGVRFSLSFGPHLVKDGKNVVPGDYLLGEVNGNFSRSAICQVGQLHYLMVVTSYEAGCETMPLMRDFADVLVDCGVRTAYNLDGGQTACLVTNGELMNRPNYGQQRTVSDMIYFATAIPGKEQQ